MHRGVRELIRWVKEHDGSELVKVHRPAQAVELAALEHQLGAPLPADLKLVLGVFDGGRLPNGVLLGAQPGPGDTIEAGLKAMAAEHDVSFLDPELLLPFHRTEAGSYLAFDRSAAPVSDTWPIVDYDLATGEMRLIHRTFDGWCRLCVEEWSSDDYAAEFTIEKYLAQGKRHTTVEPDVSIAHVTVAHGLRRAGEPEASLESYLRAGRCVPAVPWSDWEALKLAALLRYPADALEAGMRLGKRAPASMWELRETTPSRVAFALAQVAPPPGEAQEPWLRIVDQLVAQALDDDDRAASEAIRAAMVAGEPVPEPDPPQEADVEVTEDVEASWQGMLEAYRDGLLREDDLLLDPRFRAVAASHDLSDVLRVRRDF
ncbi:MAG TPA: SMI1/KNR4 family protein [Sandaracinaceae bacterium LLY-WYZ-13_1]|nr:SMI1/KNR4 family protein [Sandaracinaceae bacterium LLY-WYZ-13_1]